MNNNKQYHSFIHKETIVKTLYYNESIIQRSGLTAVVCDSAYACATDKCQVPTSHESRSHICVLPASLRLQSETGVYSLGIELDDLALHASLETCLMF